MRWAMKHVKSRRVPQVLGGVLAVVVLIFCIFHFFYQKAAGRNAADVLSTVWMVGRRGEEAKGFLLKKKKQEGDAAELVKKNGRPEAIEEAAAQEEKKVWLILRLECEVPKEFLKEVRGRVELEQRTGELLNSIRRQAEGEGAFGETMENGGQGTDCGEAGMFQIGLEGDRLVICGRMPIWGGEPSEDAVYDKLSGANDSEGGNDGKVVAKTGISGMEMLREMVVVCDKLTLARPVQAMMFPQKTDHGGKGAGKEPEDGQKDRQASGTVVDSSKNEEIELKVTESKNGFLVDTERTCEEAGAVLNRLLGNVAKNDAKGAAGAAIEAGESEGTGFAKAKESYIYIEILAKTKIIEPQLTTKQAKQCNTLLASYSTYFETAVTGRARNIAVGAAHLNGTVVYPGEEFSTAAALMPFSEENGYAEGSTFINGEVSESIGGGVCQLSSTLYNALLQTDLLVTQRYAHSMPVSYVPLGRDAAIAGDYKDLCFQNTTNVPILMLCEVKDKKVTVFLYGAATAKRAEVRLRQVTTKETPEEVWVETYREYLDADGVLRTERIAESKYRYPR